MPLQLDDYDVSILKSLLKDGRKSFREISRETGITTPTVKQDLPDLSMLNL
jgi:DNA-binding Lrp family transcriptional regulator